MNYRSITDLNRDILEWMDYLPKDIDLVVGIPRSGMLVANLIALYMNIPMADLGAFLRGQVMETGVRGQENKKNNFKKVLIVDDSVCYGTSISEAKKRLNSQHFTCQLLYAAPYIIPEAEKLIDYYFEILPVPRVFEWNLLHHSILARACVDIDGVLCRDPTNSENDDSVAYRTFINNVPARIRPSVTIKFLVTCRLEKYRDLTEEWLKRNGIIYENLVMLDLPNKEVRQGQSIHGKFKAEIYFKSKAEIFIESSIEQAIEIARYSKKPVICIEKSKIIYPNTISEFIQSSDDVFKIAAVRLKRSIKRIVLTIFNRFRYQNKVNNKSTSFI